MPEAQPIKVPNIFYNSSPIYITCSLTRVPSPTVLFTVSDCWPGLWLKPLRTSNYMQQVLHKNGVRCLSIVVGGSLRVLFESIYNFCKSRGSLLHLQYSWCPKWRLKLHSRFFTFVEVDKDHFTLFICLLNILGKGKFVQCTP